ncbi:hypothetical protein ANSO36C_63440 (plasmid) [Nostoc cf. commune SO-36]|uniref:MobA/VirD2-like nuclease domain-containing protein n=1 Tax=Nostoc cf. commune SO-36 TaxID=449208 RepID=A0ABN6QGE2_NOSCO|nr:hypothetical protein [Nostoc commune]BDI20542.1 hypothetical protein ANSO36C_63440 [Nostoc cf. commune SO-36]
MRMMIKEYALSDFEIINQFMQTLTIHSGHLVNIHAPAWIINSYQVFSKQRPRLKKVGIYVHITLKSFPITLSSDVSEQILTEYIQGIGWDDLQYVTFLKFHQDFLEFHLIFNRVMPSGEVIDLNCLGAKPQQYDVLQKSLINIIKSGMRQEVEVRSQNGLNAHSDSSKNCILQ